MRYDDDYEYNSRSSRGSSGRSSDRRSSSYSSGRDYDRSYSRDYDRGYSSYDRDYDRGYSSRDYDRRSSDRYGSRSRSYYDDFDQQDWERTAPNWDDRGASRKKSGSSSRSSSGRSSASHSGSRGGSSRSSYDYDGRSRNSDRPRGSSSRSSSSSQRKGTPQKKKKKGSIQIVPIVLGLVLIIMAALIIKSFVGGDGSDGYSIELGSETIVVDETTTATINGLSETEEYEITWGSSDPNVVSVDGNGETCSVTAKNEGSVTIAATINGETINKTIMVVDVAPGVVDIELAQETVEIKSGETYTVQATVIMESDDMQPAKISWESSDSSIARVKSDGTIEGRNVGETIVKATAGEKTAEIVVTVVENPDNQEHDESGTTGTEPEEGAVQPDDGNTSANTGIPEGTTEPETPEETDQSGETPSNDAADGTT